MWIGPERQLIGHIMTFDETQQFVTRTIDNLMYHHRAFKHHKIKENLLKVINDALILQHFNYIMIWDRRHNLVGCTRRNDAHSLRKVSTTPTP